MTLTNREIAGNETWIAAESFLECPFCEFLSDDLDLVKPVVPCPNCGRGGRPRISFPDMSSTRLLEMVSHFYMQAWDRQENQAADLADQLSEVLGRVHYPAASVEVALHAQRIRARSDGTQEAFDRLLEAIKELLGLESPAEARKVFMPLLQYSDTNEEHQITVLLTAALLEKLFKELLLRIVVHTGKDWEEARKVLKDLWRHEKRKSCFVALTGVSLEEAIAQAGVSGFYADWKEIRKLRNQFMHGLPFVIHVSAVETAFNLAKHSFEVFADLHNRHLVGTVPRGSAAT